MGKRPKKKIVLCLVEGKSDINALSYGISDLYDNVDSNYEVMFSYYRDDNQPGGDITSRFGVKPDNIEGIIYEYCIKETLRDYGLYPKDLCEIVQVVDTDGVYIDNSSIIETKTGSNGKTIYYNKDTIENANVESIIERNERKRNNLEHLLELDQLKVGSKQIPYSLYYMSCNLDHVICGDANLQSGKCKNAQAFSDRCQEDETFFLKFMMSSEYTTFGMSYKESWEYIQKDNNSLSRKTNLNVLVERLTREE